MPDQGPQTTGIGHPVREERETLDTVEIVRRRLADGRTIADRDVHALVAEIDRLRAVIRVNALRWAPHLTHEQIDEVIRGQ